MQQKRIATPPEAAAFDSLLRALRGEVEYRRGRIEAASCPVDCPCRPVAEEAANRLQAILDQHRHVTARRA